MMELPNKHYQTRARGIKSRQPRVTGGDDSADQFFTSILRWINDSEITDPPAYQLDSRTRDVWLRSFWPREPHLAGVLNSVVLIDANRGWSLVGGRNQVRRYMTILHNVENGMGWRHFARMQSLAFYTSDLGAVTEIGRDGKAGPMRSLWAVDPARCRLTGKISAPLRYYPARGKSQAWGPDDFFRITSMPSTDETLYQLGFCAVSRAVQVALTMTAVYAHDHEMLLAAAPRGLLLLMGIDQNQWDAAMDARGETIADYERRYYGGVAVLASSGMSEIDAKLIALSQLPRDFDRHDFTDMMMFAYSLIFAYAPEEFWPVRSGALGGRGTEVELMHRRATTKGALDWAILMQENIQKLLPDTLQFAFEERDVEGEIQDELARKSKLELIASMYSAGASAGIEPLISRDEARFLLASEDLIPADWTQSDEPVTVTDVDAHTGERAGIFAIRAREPAERWRDNAAVRLAAEAFPDEPIVCLRSFPSTGLRTIETIWDSGRDCLEASAIYSMPASERLETKALTRARQAEPSTDHQAADDAPALYSSGDVIITEADVERAIYNAGQRVGAEFAELLTAEPASAEDIKKTESEAEAD